MRKITTVFIPLLLLAAFAPGAVFAGDARVLHVFTWEGYFAPETVRLFEERNRCRVEFDHYDSNDTMFAMLADGGGYDVITPVANLATQMARAGHILPLDRALLPNLKYLDRKTVHLKPDTETLFGVPYTVTVTGVGYNRRLVPEDALGSWRIFDNGAFGKKMTMINDVREAVGAALKLLGYSINTVDATEIRAAGEVVKKWKRNLAAFEVDRAKEGLRGGTFAAIQAYNGDVALIIADNPEIGFYIPREGSALNADDFVIGADTAVSDLAHAFINHYLDPEIAAMNMAAIYFYMPNPEALEKLAPELRDNPAFMISDDIMAKSEMIIAVEDEQGLYDEVWSDILLSQ